MLLLGCRYLNGVVSSGRGRGFGGFKRRFGERNRGTGEVLYLGGKSAVFLSRYREV